MLKERWCRVRLQAINSSRGKPERVAGWRSIKAIAVRTVHFSVLSRALADELRA